LVNFGRVVAMTAHRSHFRLPLIVVTAIMGTLCVVEGASACSTNTPGNAASACCAGRGQSACCCESVKTEPQSKSIDRILVRTPGEARHFSPASSCECRTGNPAEPARKPESPTSRRRADQDRVRPVELISEIRPAIALVRLVLPTESPPGTSLFLRTTHLLI
jgi:hypothetical protein